MSSSSHLLLHTSAPNDLNRMIMAFPYEKFYFLFLRSGNGWI